MNSYHPEKLGESLNWSALTKGLRCCVAFFASMTLAIAQEAHPQPARPPAGAKAAKCANRKIPQFTDVTAKSGIHFSHISSPDSRYVVESMSGGVILIDYDR